MVVDGCRWFKMVLGGCRSCDSFSNYKEQMNLYSYLAQFQVPAEVNRSVDIFCIFATQVRNANVKQQDVSQGKMEGFFT